MKHVRKNAIVLGLLLALCMAFAIPSLGETTLKLVMWTYGVETVLDNIAKFEATYPDINVELEDVSWYAYPETLAMRFASGDAPDVLYVNDAWLSSWAGSQWIVPFSEYFPEVAAEHAPLMKPYVRECITYDDKLWGLPYYVDTYVMMANGRQLEEAGITSAPTTWDELMLQCIAVKNAGITEYPFIGEFHQDEHSMTNVFFSMVYSNSPSSLFDEDLNPLFAVEGSAAYEALEWLREAALVYEIFDPASLALKEIDVYKAMQGGTGTFTIMEKYTLGEMNAPGSGPNAGSFELYLMPGDAHGTIGSAKFYAMTAQAADKGADVVDAVGKLIEFMGGKANSFATAKRWSVENSLGFGYTHLYDDAAIQDGINTWGNFAVEKEQEVLAVQMEGISAPWFAEWSTSLRLAIHKLLLGDKSSMEVLEDLASEWNSLKATY